MADHLWLIGSPETVASKIRKLYTEVGGFGCLGPGVRSLAGPEGMGQSTRLAEEVMPRLADLTGRKSIASYWASNVWSPL